MMNKPFIAVTGKNGQLGSELQLIAKQYPDFNFIFTGSAELDITNPEAIKIFFQDHTPKYLINCAAYTAVDKAESDQEITYQTNAEAVGTLANECRISNCTLITISTDYVFDGTGDKPYRSDDVTSPVNYYGYTKLTGENLAVKNNPNTIVLRTSWVYSTYGKNFVKTMLALMASRPEISVVNDQIGSPTYAHDLAETILEIILSLEKGNTHYGIYHYSNTGNISWYEFAKAIGDIAGSGCIVKPISTKDYPTPAKRPAYSVLDTSAIHADYHIAIKNWQTSLRACIREMTA